MAIGPSVSLQISGPDFSGKALFAGLKIDIAPGEVVALLGSSGVGKTTLLRIIAGLERGFSGQCQIGGQPANLAPAPGFVFQDARLLPWLDASANLRLACPDLTPPQIEALLAQVGLAGQSRAYPRQMSGGMQRRLGLARALAAGSGLLLLDEPFASLDGALVAEMHQLCHDLFKAEKPTVVLITHDPADALRLADRVIVLQGRPAQMTADIRLNDSGKTKDLEWMEIQAALKTQV